MLKPAPLLRQTAYHRQPRGRITWFVLVGCAAAAVHWSAVVLLVTRFALPPLLANVIGWLLAFGVSFTGHHRLSFRGHDVPLRASALRFFAISALGFAINEGSYALLLQWTQQRYDLVLGVVLLGVAVLTYWLSRHWAFLRNPGV